MSSDYLIKISPEHMIFGIVVKIEITIRKNEVDSKFRVDKQVIL